MRPSERVVDRLEGGHPRTLGETEVVVADVVADAGLEGELWEAVEADDPVVVARAVDALEKVSRVRPSVLRGHEAEVLDLLSTSTDAKVRWHVGLLVPRLALDADDVGHAAAVLRRLRNDPSRIAQAFALDGLLHLADDHPELAEEAEAALDAALRSPFPSVRARARRLLR